MEEQRKIKNKIIGNMLLNFLVFTILFLSFDVILYRQMIYSIYKSVDTKILLEEELYKKNNRNIWLEILEGKHTKMNPRLIYIVRNEQGEVLNKTSLGSFYTEFLEQDFFYKNELNTIYQIKLDNTDSYRGLTFIDEKEGQPVLYIQILANVQAENEVLQKLLKTLLLGTSIIIFFALLASYLLAKRAVRPMIETWKKQSEFFQNASHELRTPLTIIQAKQELLLQEPQSKIIDKSEEIMLALTETRRLTKLINELMTLARADSEEIQLQKEPTNIDIFIKEIIKPYQEIAEVQNKKFKYLFEYNKNIKIDRNKIHQLFVILLDNALKYTGENDSILIKTKEKDGKCVIIIEDTGIGISEEALEHIFERFYRENKARTRQKGGTGLGLSIAKMILDSHGGTIKIIQNQPKGTKVILKL